ncbi:hypothetical protein HXZ66_01965 [Bacillus sp. A116_S68]|nr:hypothetical protein HXZ66_01965 [Bacillus sp. A116_S68]
MFKRKYTIMIACVVAISFFTYIFFQSDDIEDIEEVLDEFNIFLYEVDIELVDKQYAIATYHWGHPFREKLGVVELEKTLFGWDIVRATSHRAGWKDKPQKAPYTAAVSELTESTVIVGRIFDDVVEIEIETKDGTHYGGQDIILNNNLSWHFIPSESVDFSGTTIRGLSKDGQVNGEVYIDDDLTVHYRD